MFFANRFFYLRRPPGLKLAFDAAKTNGKFGRIYCQKSKESSGRGKKKRGVFLCRRTVGVKVNSKVISTSSVKIEEKGRSLGPKSEKKRGS